MHHLFLIDSPIGFVAVIAIILFATKSLGLVFRHFGLPQVLGFIIAGIIIGPAIFGELCGASIIGFEGATGLGGREYFSLFAIPEGHEGLEIFSKIGVLLLMFSAGLETNLEELKHTGLASALTAVVGVVVPMVLGFLISLPFGNIGLGFSDTNSIFKCVFIGTILTATSVAITVSVLKELGKINTKLGTTIVSAAIIDDVIGIVLLSIVTGIARSGAPVQAEGFFAPFEQFKATIYGTIIMIVAFFVFAIGMGWVVSKVFKWMDKRYPSKIRLSIYSLVVCFAYSWLAEEIFGVADITGAFLAGIVLSTDHRASVYVDEKVDASSRSIFAPIFFANIGISSISFLGFKPEILLFVFLAVLAGLIGKILGCGSVFKAFKYNLRESAIGGVGMMARGEVALIVTGVVTNTATLGAAALGSEFMLMTVLLILVSSILTPVLLKTLYKGVREPLHLDTIDPDD